MSISLSATRVTGLHFDRPRHYSDGCGLDPKGGFRTLTILFVDGRQESISLHADDVQALRLPGENSKFEVAPEPMPTDDVLEEPAGEKAPSPSELARLFGNHMDSVSDK